MIIAVPKETFPSETRVAIIPDTVAKLVQKSATVVVQSGLGDSIHLKDQAYKDAGAEIVNDAKTLYSKADVILKLRKPSKDEIRQMKAGAVYTGMLDPFHEKELVEAFAAQGVSAISMEMIPRSTRAQKMDVLSSQASLAGYVAVILAAERLDQILPMMMTPAGTIKPTKVFIIGAGVAGLQAIATAKRLGARVEAFDTRAVVEEEVKSLGAKFVKIDLGETGQTKDGYAKALTEEQLKIQRDGMARACTGSDIVITTAQLFGRKAPVIVTREMVAGMKPGSVIVDLAADTGGNVEGSKAGEEVIVNGVKILGLTNLPGRVPVHASQMLSANFFHLLDEFWNDEVEAFELKLDDDIISASLLTHEKKIVNEMIVKHYQ